MVESDDPSALIQIHLIQHSTRLPHPLAFSPVVDVCILKDTYGAPMVNAAISGGNLALVISTAYYWKGDLSVWNWRTGVKKGEVHVPEPRVGIHFLREDLLLNGNLTDMSLDTYRILEPNLTSCSGMETEENKSIINHVQLVHRFGLPQIKENHYETTEIFCHSQPSCSLPSSQKTNLPFTSDPLSAILLIEVGIRRDDWGSENFRKFTFIMHRRTLLNLTLDVVDSPKKDSSEIDRVPWAAWGPNSTRMLADDFTDLNCLTAVNGTRCIWLHGPHLEVLDFGSPNTKPQAMPKEDNVSDADGVQVHLVDTESIYPAGRGPFTQDVQTYLPYVSSSRLVSLGEKSWKGVFMDDEKIVGFTKKFLHILHL